MEYKLDVLVGLVTLFMFQCIQTVCAEDEICSTVDDVIKFCDGDTSYCCNDGNACCPNWHTDVKLILLGFLCLCASALIIPLMCTICAYCIFNVILKERNTPKPETKDAEASIGQEESTTERKFPSGIQYQEKYAPEVFISPEEFVLDLQSKSSDKKCLIVE